MVNRIAHIIAALVLAFIALLLVWGCIAVCAQIAALIG